MVNSEGNPLPEALVSLSWKGWAKNSVITDKNGTYKINGLIIGDEHRIYARANGYIFNYDIGKFIAKADTTPRDDIVLTPQGKRWLEGKVINSDGNPVAGAQVSNRTTDKDGYFRRDNIDGVAIDLFSIRHKDYGIFEFWWIPTNQKHVFTLIKGKHTLSGKIVDVDGNPIKDALIMIKPVWHESGKYRRSQETRPDGKFKFENIIENFVNLFVHLPEIGSKTFEKVKVDRDEIKLVFDKPDEGKTYGFVFKKQGVVMLEGESAPKLEVNRWINGDPVKLNDLRGKVVVLDFMNHEEIRKDSNEYTYTKTRLIKALQEEYGDRGVVCIGIHEHTDDIETVKKLIKENKLQYSIAIDKKSSEPGSRGKTFDTYAVSRFNKNIVVDKNGNTHPDIYGQYLENKVKELLK